MTRNANVRAANATATRKGNALPMDSLALMAKAFKIEFSETEQHLLTTPRDDLDPMQKQYRHLLMMALTPVPCPACRAEVPIRAAALTPQDTGAGFSAGGDDDYACPFCLAKLHHWLDIHGQFGWDLQPGQRITVT